MTADDHEECRVAYRKVADVAARHIRREEELTAEVERLRAELARLRSEAQDAVLVARQLGVHLGPLAAAAGML